MSYATQSIDRSARGILHSIRLLELQAAKDLEGAELAEFNKKHPRGADGRFGGGGKSTKPDDWTDRLQKAKQAGLKNVDDIDDARLANGQSVMEVEKERAIAKKMFTDFAKKLDEIHGDYAKRKAAFDSIGPNVHGAIESIGKNFNNTNKNVNDGVHKLMDDIGSGIRSNSQNVGDTIGKEITAASLYLKQMQSNAGSAVDSAKKDAATSIGRAATGLAAFLSPEHLAQVGKDMSKTAMDGAKKTPANIKSMLDNLAAKAKDSIDKGTTAIKDFGSGFKAGFTEGAVDRFTAKPGDPKLPTNTEDNTAKSAGRKVGRFVGERPQLTGSMAGVAVTAAFGAAGPLSISIVVGSAIGEDLRHPHSEIKKHVGDAYNMAKSTVDRGTDGAKALVGKAKDAAKDLLDKATAQLAIATVAKDDKKVEQHKNEIADLASKIGDIKDNIVKTSGDAVANLQQKLEPLLKQAQQEIEKSPAARATAIGVGLGSLLVGPGALTLGIPAIGVAKGIDNISNKAKQGKAKTKVQASASPQLLMASVIGASAKKIVASI